MLSGSPRQSGRRVCGLASTCSTISAGGWSASIMVDVAAMDHDLADRAPRRGRGCGAASRGFAGSRSAALGVQVDRAAQLLARARSAPSSRATCDAEQPQHAAHDRSATTRVSGVSSDDDQHAHRRRDGQRHAVGVVDARRSWAAPRRRSGPAAVMTDASRRRRRPRRTCAISTLVASAEASDVDEVVAEQDRRRSPAPCCSRSSLTSLARRLPWLRERVHARRARRRSAPSPTPEKKAEQHQQQRRSSRRSIGHAIRLGHGSRRQAQAAMASSQQRGAPRRVGTSPATKAWPMPRARTKVMRPSRTFLSLRHVRDQARRRPAPVAGIGEARSAGRRAARWRAHARRRPRAGRGRAAPRGRRPAPCRSRPPRRAAARRR